MHSRTRTLVLSSHTIRPVDRCPDATLLFRVLAPAPGSDEVMFNEFCVHLFAHPHLKLPLHVLEFPLHSVAADEFAQRTFAAQTGVGIGIGSGAGDGTLALRVADLALHAAAHSPPR